MRETTRLRFEPEEHLTLLALMERYISSCGLSPANGDPGSIQILTGTAVPTSDR
jgi:hypothetical protein